jgi:formylglycine-generating enzyme required for sulfatase activity
MKRAITILIITMFVFPALEAQPKKVVILEPSENLSIMQKAILRAKIAEALTHSGNYETFTNTDVDHDLICTTQLLSEADDLLIESKLIEANSGNIVTTATQHIAKKPITEFEQGCLQLAVKLAWWSSVSTSSKTLNMTNPRNGEVYNPDGIELVYVESSDTGSMAIKSFFIGKFEVTQRQWKAIMGDNFSHFTGDSLPVENVNWWEIQKFLSKLNAVTGHNYRLPAETEWEFAARGGITGKEYTYSGSDNINDVAWYQNNSGAPTLKKKYENGKRMKYIDNIGKCTHPVGNKEPNELGIYDMTGNVWEWCADWYDSSQQYKVVRGGGWDNNALVCRLSSRVNVSPSNRDSHLGFRVMCSF